jgi:hypothetical protein
MNEFVLPDKKNVPGAIKQKIPVRGTIALMFICM